MLLREPAVLGGFEGFGARVIKLRLDGKDAYGLVMDETGTAVQTEDAKTGKPIIQLAIPYDIDTYPQSTLTTPVEPWTSDLGRDVTVHAELSAVDSGGRVVLSVKKSPAIRHRIASLITTWPVIAPESSTRAWLIGKAPPEPNSHSV